MYVKLSNRTPESQTNTSSTTAAGTIDLKKEIIIINNNDGFAIGEVCIFAAS